MNQLTDHPLFEGEEKKEDEARDLLHEIRMSLLASPDHPPEDRDFIDQIRGTLLLAQAWLANSVPVVQLDGAKPLPAIDRALKLLASRDHPTPEGNEGYALRRLSDALTGGNASTWDEVFHAAESRPEESHARLLQSPAMPEVRQDDLPQHLDVQQSGVPAETEPRWRCFDCETKDIEAWHVRCPHCGTLSPPGTVHSTHPTPEAQD